MEAVLRSGPGNVRTQETVVTCGPDHLPPSDHVLLSTMRGETKTATANFKFVHAFLYIWH